MFSAKSGVFVVSLLSLALAGCGSDRFAPAASAPPPLTPAPSGAISGSQLPPPSSPTGPSAFPQAPGQTTDMAALDPSAGAGAASGPAVTAGGVAGVWNVNVGGQSCRVATPQTKFGQGYRAGPLRCPAPIDNVKSWNVEGSQLSFYDENGQALARLTSAGNQNFNGQTTSGQPISLSR